MSKSIVKIVPYFGRWPEWINFYIESVKANPTIDWIIYTDCPEPRNRADNLIIRQMSFADYKALVSERLNIRFDPDNPYKLCDLKPMLGLLHEQDNLQLAEVGTAVLDATHLWEWADRILAIDAMQGDGSPGSVYLAPLDQILAGERAHGTHTLSMADALRCCVDKRWDAVELLGIEPCSLQLGMALSPPVEAAVPVAADLAAKHVNAWLAG